MTKDGPCALYRLHCTNTTTTSTFFSFYHFDQVNSPGKNWLKLVYIRKDIKINRKRWRSIPADGNGVVSKRIQFRLWCRFCLLIQLLRYGWRVGCDERHWTVLATVGQYTRQINLCFPLGVGGNKEVRVCCCQRRRETNCDCRPDARLLLLFLSIYIAVVVCLRSRNDKGKNEKRIKIFWI
jgi:hypothetical protein